MATLKIGSMNVVECREDGELSDDDDVIITEVKLASNSNSYLRRKQNSNSSRGFIDRMRQCGTSFSSHGKQSEPIVISADHDLHDMIIDVSNIPTPPPPPLPSTSPPEAPPPPLPIENEPSVINTENTLPKLPSNKYDIARCLPSIVLPPFPIANQTVVSAEKNVTQSLLRNASPDSHSTIGPPSHCPMPSDIPPPHISSSLTMGNKINETSEKANNDLIDALLTEPMEDLAKNRRDMLDKTEGNATNEDYATWVCKLGNIIVVLDSLHQPNAK